MPTAFQSEDSTKGRLTDEFIGQIDLASNSVHDEEKKWTWRGRRLRLSMKHATISGRTGRRSDGWVPLTYEMVQIDYTTTARLHNTERKVPSPRKAGPCRPRYSSPPTSRRDSAIGAVTATSPGAAK